MTSTRIGGTVDPRFEPVRDAFVRNFTEHGEIGAAVCIRIDGRVVVDLWGGHADAAGRRREWSGDTLVNTFSVGKGMVALLFAQLVGDGAVDVDTRVADIWAEFAAAGKQDVTIREVLSHQAGLPAFHRRMPPDSMLDWQAMTAALAAEAPWWEPGTAHGYHVNTFGFLAGEVLRRVTGRSVGTLLRERVAAPLGADVHLGVPPSATDRIADFLWPFEAPPEEEPPGLFGLELMRHNAYWNPSGLSGAGVVNTEAWRRAELPSTNLHASARGVATVYAALAAGGTLDGVQVVDPAALAASTVEQVEGDDLVLGRPSRFALGFQLTQPERPLGPNPGAYGHFGAGGSLGFCDPQTGVGFGYVMNELGARWQNPRNSALVEALYASLG